MTQHVKPHVPNKPPWEHDNTTTTPHDVKSTWQTQFGGLAMPPPGTVFTTNARDSDMLKFCGLHLTIVQQPPFNTFPEGHLRDTRPCSALVNPICLPLPSLPYSTFASQPAPKMYISTQGGCKRDAKQASAPWTATYWGIQILHNPTPHMHTSRQRLPAGDVGLLHTLCELVDHVTSITLQGHSMHPLGHRSRTRRHRPCKWIATFGQSKPRAGAREVPCSVK